MNNNRQPVNPDNSKMTALYERLSKDDMLKNESISIANQKLILEDYARRNGFPNIRHFTDDGITGTVFNRPGLNAMVEEVRAGNVATVIIKDQSRIGRDVLEVGLLKRTFEENNVRFIAAEDGFDSANGFDIMSIFRDVINEMYVADTSRKITAVLRAKGKEGKRTTNNVIYGFMKDPQDKDKWLVDEEAAAVVRRIYQMTIEGMGPYQIARQLTLDRVPCPSYYLAQRGQGTHKNRAHEKPHLWRGATVRDFLAKPEYKGDTVNFRSYKDSYKDKRPKKTAPEDLLIFENTHEAIVDRETWETAQRCRKTVRRTDTWGEANPLTGLLFCADCGAKMYNHRGMGGWARDWHGNPTGERRPFRDEYNCSAYNQGNERYERRCSQHYIRSEVIRELVLDVIRRVSLYAKSNEEDFIRQVRETSALRQDEAAKAHRKRIQKNEKRIAELDSLFRKTYEDNANGKLSDMRFEQLSGAYEKEQAELIELTDALKAELAAFDADSTRADRFMELVKRYTDFTDLTAPMLHEFVEKILVHEGDRSGGERVQKVDIYLNFIGKFDVPLPEPAPEELAEAEEARRKREKKREYNQRYMEKKRRKEEAAQAEQEQREEKNCIIITSGGS